MSHVRILAALILCLAGSLAFGQAASPALPPASAGQLPRWRGFNLLEKFSRDWNNGPFVEEDFRQISELGFNFVRLPMDYRAWIVGDDWTKFNEQSLKEIDQAVEWGGKYGIHVMINFHRAPGYTVAKPPEKTSLWTDAETQKVCAMHWAEFARRYKGVGNDRLSFNLFNEPGGVEAEAYVAVVKQMVAAIRARDPDRLIVSDGLQWGQRPIPELKDLGIAQATRGYTPMEISHYLAEWIDGAQAMREPTWPRLLASGTLCSPAKPDMDPKALTPITVTGPFDAETALRIRVGVVSSRATLVVRADGKPVWQREFVCGPGEGEWKSSRHFPQWDTYQCIYDRDYRTTIPAGTQRVEIAVAAGDWLDVTELGLAGGGGGEHSLAMQRAWNLAPASFTYTPTAEGGPFVGLETQDRTWLNQTAVLPWVELKKQGVGVMVGEFGAYNKTPHDVVLRWMEDWLVSWKAADMGWAMWTFRGSFGILDSDRADVTYEDFHGHKLDRKMLELLQRY
jgi:aryl-phospho-beta-D-glucosidase BglC (GH1 family)